VPQLSRAGAPGGRHVAPAHSFLAKKPLFAVESLDRELMQRARSYLDDVVAQLAQQVRTAVNAALVEGWVPDAIAQHAKTVGADLLVLTTRSHSGLARFWLGSVSEALLRQAETPILFVPPRETPPSLSDAPTLRHVLVPLDGSDFAEQVLDRVDTLTAGALAEYTVLRVFKPMTPTRSDVDTARVSGLRESLLQQLLELDKREGARAQAYVERVAESLRAGVPSPVVHTRVVSNDRPADAVLHEASRDRVDVIALATHGRTALKRLLVDDSLRGRLSVAARQRIEVDFDARKEAMKLHRLMAKAVSDAP
jgi:nucleotide-binding universal stress UspA family protein